MPIDLFDRNFGKSQNPEVRTKKETRSKSPEFLRSFPSLADR